MQGRIYHVRGQVARVVRLSAAACLFSATTLSWAQSSFPQLPSELQVTPLRKREPTPSAMAAPEDLVKVRLGPDYVLQMDLYDTPEMDATLRVDEGGDVSLPLVGRVHVGGDTLVEAQDAIAKALRDGEILKAPQVTLNVVQFAPLYVTILGEVQAPGRIQLLAPRTLDEVLAEAGGETSAAGNQIEVRHADGSSPTQLLYVAGKDPKQLGTTKVSPGDTVIVPRAGAVYVMGSVSRPGAYLMVNGGSLNLLEAISLAEGTTLRASVSNVEILRPNGEGYTRLRVPLKKMQKGDVSPTPLMANDIVYVPVSEAKSIFLDGATIMAAAATSSIYLVR